jgi:type II secretory pathway pseudopilin PulG/sugar lactone lactonase YvrE
MKQGLAIFFKNNKGLTLIELLITMGIVIILAGIGASSYFGYQTQQSVDAVASELLANLRDVQQKAISQDQGSAWGVRINAVSDDNDYYEIFYGNNYVSGTVSSRVTLPSDVEFLVPAQSNTMEILFAKSTGLPASDYVITIASIRDSSVSKTITLNTISGLIDLNSGLGSSPILSSISPNSASNISPVYITNLAGNNFQNLATIKLTKAGQSDILCTDVVFVSSEKLTGTCDITGKIGGAWDVVVTNPDGQLVSLSSGFSIYLPAPTILAINPSSGINSGPVSISSVTGTNFVSGATVKLTKTAQADINCSGFTFTDSSTLSNGSCDITSKDIGNWNVVVTNPDSQLVTLTDGFSVTTITILVPGVPNLTSVVSGNGQATLNWTAPSSDGGSSITNYEIYRSTSSGSETFLAEVGNVLTYTNTSLTNGTTYYYKVAAKNSVGIGSQSNEMSVVLAPIAPSAPQSLSATNGNQQVTLNWLVPTDNGGSAVTNYEIYRSTSSGGEGSTPIAEVGNVLTYTNTGLTNDTTYYYKVAAKNSVGIGSQSNEISGIPSIWIAEASTMDWRGVAMSSTGQYQTAVAYGENIYISSDTGNTWTAKATPLNWTSVAMSSTGQYQTAVASGGQIYVSSDYGNAWAAAGNTTTWTGVAVSSTGQYQTAVAANDYVYVSTDYGTSWTAKGSVLNWSGVALSSDGVRQSATVNGGNIYVSSDSGNTWAGSTFRRYESNQWRTYTSPSRAYTAIAMNSSGSIQTAVVDGGYIYTSTQYWIHLSSVPAGKGSALSWRGIAMSSDGVLQTAVANNDRIYVSAGSGSTWTGQGGTKGWVGVAMSAGGSKRTAIASVDKIYVAILGPSAARNLAAIGGNQAVALTWETPTDDGGSAITNYEIYRSTTSGGEVWVAELSNILSYIDTGLLNDTTYYYKVAAKNSVGDIGTKSSEASAATRGTPSAPQSFTTIAQNQQITLTWQAPADDRGAAVTNYEIYRSTTSGGETLLSSGGCSNLGIVFTCTDTGLTNDIIYYYKIAARNSFGIGLQSSEINAIPNDYSTIPYFWVIDSDNDIATEVKSLDGSVVRTYNTGYGLYPYGVAVDLFGNVWIARVFGTGTVIKLNSAGSLVGTYNAGSSPRGVAIDASGNVWVANQTGTVTKLNSVGSLVGTYNAGSQPWSIAIDSSNNVWVVNAVSDNVTKLNSSGGLIGTYSVGDYPQNIAIDSFDNVWVSNSTGNSVTELNSSGGLIGTYSTGSYPSGIAVDASGNIWVANFMSNTVTKLNSAGSIIGTYSVTNPLNLGFDASGNLWVTTTSNLLIKLNSAGSVIGSYSIVSDYTSGDFTGFVLQCFISKQICAAPSIPSAPLNLSAAGGNQQAILNWQAPSSSGGSAITYYEIYRSTTSGGETFLTEVGNVLTYTNTGLTNGITYYYNVAAKNGLGNIGPRSSEVNVYLPLTPTVPSAPRNLYASKYYSPLRNSLFWQAPSSDGGSPITNYEIYYVNPDLSTTFLAEVGNVLTYDDTSIIASGLYHYSVAAKNSVGIGSMSFIVLPQ